MTGLGRIGRRDEEPAGPPPPIEELRRGYHDRIAEVRERSLEILRCAIAGVARATQALGPSGGLPAERSRCDLRDAQELAAAVDADVVGLLALESPMARDLRVILVSRDVTQIGLLCVGLCATLETRVERAAGALSPDLSRLVAEVGAATEALVREAEAAWSTLDPGRAATIPVSAVGVRTLQTEFTTALLGLDGVPMDSALDLAMVARALERLADHAVEIADRVAFAAGGGTARSEG